MPVRALRPDWPSLSSHASVGSGGGTTNARQGIETCGQEQQRRTVFEVAEVIQLQRARDEAQQ